MTQRALVVGLKFENPGKEFRRLGGPAQTGAAQRPQIVAVLAVAQRNVIGKDLDLGQRDRKEIVGHRIEQVGFPVGQQLVEGLAGGGFVAIARWASP